MNDIFKTILNSPAITYTKVGAGVVHSGLRHGLSPAYIVRQLPLIDRINLYSQLVAVDGPCTDIPHETCHEIVTTIGDTIDLKDEATIPTALQLFIGRPDIREKRDVPEQNDKRFDGYKSAQEQNYQLWLAYTVAQFLPFALGISPAAFVTTRLDESEQGASLAILSVQSDPCSEIVQNASLLLRNACRLTPGLWRSFQKVSQHLAQSKPHHEIEGEQRGLYSAWIEKLVDDIIGREIHSLSPQQIGSLNDQRAYDYLNVLMGFAGSGQVTDTFKAARLHLFSNLSISSSFSLIRARQINQLAAFFSVQTEEEFAVWTSIKQRWHSLDSQEKDKVLRPYINVLGKVLDIPQIPEVLITVRKNLPDKLSSEVNGQFEAWKLEIVDGKCSEVWVNRVVILDDYSEEGTPLAAKISFRSTVTTTTHEFLHSDHEQYIIRLGQNDRHAKYIAGFDNLKKPSPINFGHPFGYAAAVLDITNSGFGDRGRYLSVLDGATLYRAQPTEKWTFGFDNQFAAAFNGAIVLHQVNNCQRKLPEEVGEIFKKIAHVLTARASLLGDDRDLAPFDSYITGEHPFGALALKDKTTTQDNGLAVLSWRDRKTDVLGELQESLHILAGNGTGQDRDFIPLFRQSAEFLVQMPYELRAIKNHLMPDESTLADRLEGLARQCHELAEDLVDYSFMATRVPRQKIVADLVACL